MTLPIASRVAIAALVGLVLAGCAASDDGSARFLVAPGQYVIYNCPQLADAARAIGARQRELEGLMAKAGVDSAGRFVSGIAYRPEYLQLRGQMTELRKEAAEKRCRFIPGLDMPGDKTSDSVVR